MYKFSKIVESYFLVGLPVVCLSGYFTYISGINLKLEEVVTMITFPLYLVAVSKFGFKKIDVYILVFFLMLLISSFVDQHGDFLYNAMGMYYFLRFFFLASLVIKVRQFFSPKFIERAFSIVMYIAFYSSLISILQRFDFSKYLGIIVPHASFSYAGMSRVIGIMGGPNVQALFAITGYLCSRLLKAKVIFPIIFIISVLFTGSNTNIAILFLLLAYDFRKLKGVRKIGFGILAIIMLGLFSSLFFIRLAQKSSIGSADSYFRIEATFKSVQAFKDYPLLGVGPGEWGGSVASFHNSYYEKKYGLFARWVNAIQHPETIDLFWPHLLAETGILGTLLYCILLFIAFKNILHKKGIYNYLFLMLFALVLSSISMLSIENTMPAFIIFSLSLLVKGDVLYNSKIKETLLN